jgi:hypothetical protein
VLLARAILASPCSPHSNVCTERPSHPTAFSQVSNVSRLGYNIYQAMLPITPTEVGYGFVKGKERLLTLRAGNFSFSRSHGGGASLSARGGGHSYV